MSGKSLTALRFQQSQIRIDDGVDLDHAGSREQDQVRQLNFAAHARSVRATEVGQVCVTARSGVDESAADDVVVLHSPLDLAALVSGVLRLAVRDPGGPAGPL